MRLELLILTVILTVHLSFQVRVRWIATRGHFRPD